MIETEGKKGKSTGTCFYAFIFPETLLTLIKEPQTNTTHDTNRYCSRSLLRFYILCRNSCILDMIGGATKNLFVVLVSINLLAFYHECRSLIGYATHVVLIFAEFKSHALLAAVP